MIKDFKQNSYNPGDLVYASANPTLKLIIRRYIDTIYYCKTPDFPDRKELVYFEREFVPNPELIEKNNKNRTV
ncbi:hypothetical protein GCM10007049_33440 [Echinicola pacifica]|uniref:Uncharacterized protein n=1 Tax=Echinicola pacifica TaxID=346377 RepID=A0A918UWA8_9BACT|nr:hypothetical protein [Echinicola pacifica]GGZ37539.1 hypothetical protein GCM10007049_33440 [Echinicola pacifica]